MNEEYLASYSRLSKEDLYKSKEAPSRVYLNGHSVNNKESNSIKNQRQLINKYIANHADLSCMRQIEFADDGYSGTNFERP